MDGPSPLRGALLSYAEAMNQLHAMHEGQFQPPLIHPFVLNLGCSWQPAPRSEVPLGEPKMCFLNATEAAFGSERWVYCEGFAWRDQQVLPIHHAWLIDATSGLVHDPTWGEPVPSVEYLGVAFQTSVVVALTLKQGFYGLLASDYGYRGTEVYDMAPEEFRHPIHGQRS